MFGSIGMPELIIIFVIALIIFGPRKLPELGKSLGQAMSQFRKASDEFKRTWEQEVELENVRKSSSSSSSNYDSNQQHEAGEAGYNAESDFNYNYGSSSTDSLSASEAAAQNGAETAPAALPEASAVAATAEKKAEPHWI